MEMPPYRFPTARGPWRGRVGACKTFLRKVGKIILATTIVLWALLEPAYPGRRRAGRGRGRPRRQHRGVHLRAGHSNAASAGKFVEPVFDPLGFDWRINVGVLASMSAREVFVATMGQVAAAEHPDNPGTALQQMTVDDGPRAGELLFTPPVVAALLVFFVYALQCMSTIGMLRRESGSWRWPAIAFGYIFAVAWVMALVAHIVVGAVT